jgi:urocanate hydratase
MEGNAGSLDELTEGIPDTLPDMPEYDSNVDHAPSRIHNLSQSDRALAIRNALRYFPKHHHQTLAKEFAHELNQYGRIYMHRLRPTNYDMRAHPIDEYPANCKQAAAIMMMIHNNLDSNVAQYPHELITYGGNGSVFQNWAQYRLTMQYLSQMSNQQTLVMYSGHPLGLFPSHSDAPRVVITNGMMIPNYSSTDQYERFNALGVTQYGQMTAGSYMYIGPQGIVHGTMITILNAARQYLGRTTKQGLEGVTFVSSGLGGMSGAQAKAAVISGASCIIAEINPNAAIKRHSQGWIDELTHDVDDAIDKLVSASKLNKPISIGYVGNIVALWERLSERKIKIDLGSDQTSLHNPFQGGYYPVDYSFDEAQVTMTEDPELFKKSVRNSLVRHSSAINSMVSNGMKFWDYGNAFLLEASRAGADIIDDDGQFIYPSYVEDIMGPMCFDFGFGPFRWVCCSGKSSDLEMADNIAMSILEQLSESASDDIKQQYSDNIKWINTANDNDLVVGSMARILYADEQGRIAIASAFNDAIRDGKISGPIVLGRDHHDVSGTDSPYRETANIHDGSMFTADMSVQNFVGDAFRGATWVSMHNGGGVGWGEVMNGGFGLLIDGSNDASRRLHSMLSWDVNNGVARRAWARNSGAEKAAELAMKRDKFLSITLPNHVDDEIIDRILDI